MEFYKKYRPTTFKAMIGNDAIKRELMEHLAAETLPHAIMITGGSGCGKTTIGRILRKKLGSGDMDYVELNCARIEKPLNAVRDMEYMARMSPGDGSCRVWVLDEVQALSRAKFAQEGLLKLLEDTPRHCYFILCTTDPERVLPTIRNRCTRYHLKALSTVELDALINRVIEAENLKLTDAVIQAIAEASDGSPRKCLVMLESVAQHKDEKSQLASIQNSDAKHKAIELAQALMWKPQWAQVSTLLKSIEEDPEALRRMIRGYAASVLLNGGKFAPRAHFVLENFSEETYFFDRPALVLACWRTVLDK